MRAAAKDVHKIRGQSRKEVPEVQTFRWETGTLIRNLKIKGPIMCKSLFTTVFPTEMRNEVHLFVSIQSCFIQTPAGLLEQPLKQATTA